MLNGKSILITGGTGSLAQKLVAILYGDYHLRRIIIFSRDEYKQAVMREQWPDTIIGSPFRYHIGDVRNLERLIESMNGVDYVIHAAAMKRIESCEYDPFEAKATNCDGTENVIRAALQTSVKRVLVVTSDKAAAPATYYGATKALAEHLTVLANAYRGQRITRLAAARYGNVLGSRGSVLHLFQEQAKAGTVTITHPNMTRFWVTLEQAAKFVLSCLETMQGGEVFAPHLPAMNIRDMALAIAPNATVEYVGLRVAEKLEEVLVSGDESYRTVALNDRFVILPSHPYWPMDCYADLPRLPEGWSYTSANADRWLSGKELKEMIDAG